MQYDMNKGSHYQSNETPGVDHIPCEVIEEQVYIFSDKEKVQA